MNNEVVSSISQNRTSWWLSLISIGGGVGFLGYFVAVGVADELCIGFGSLIGAPLDLMHYATLGFLGWVSVMSDFSLGKFYSLMRENPVNWVVFITVTALLLIIFFLDKSKEAVRSRKERMRNFYERHKDEWYAIAIKIFLSVFAYPVINHLVLMIIPVLTVCLLMPMLIGAISGKLYVRNFVLKPEGCSSVAPYSEKQAAINQSVTDKVVAGAECGKVSWIESNKSKSETGRVVASTSNYVLFYKPKTGEAKRVPLTGQAIFEAVSKID